MASTEFKNEYKENGVTVEKKNPGIKVTYNGLLAQSGADKVYAYYGYSDNWLSRDVHEMEKTDKGFELMINEDVKNVAFKDSTNHWDNNNGKNYSIS